MLTGEILALVAALLITLLHRDERRQAPITQAHQVKSDAGDATAECHRGRAAGYFKAHAAQPGCELSGEASRPHLSAVEDVWPCGLDSRLLSLDS